MKSRRILLTGASGFAGAHMLRNLLEKTNYYIYCPVTFLHGGSKQRILDLIPIDFVERYSLLEVDLAKSRVGIESLEIDYIVNFASESHVDNSIINPQPFVSNNINLIMNLLESVRESNTRIPFLHISTDEVYGEIKLGDDVKEWVSKLSPSNPYSASKAMQEELILSYQRTYGIRCCIFNITNMIGEAQNVEKFLPRALSRVINRETINIDTNTDGHIGSRKYVYVKDVADGILLILDKIGKGDISLETNVEKFHISGASEFSNLDIVKIISECLNTEPVLTFNPSPRIGYDLRYDLNSQKIRSLGWRESQSVPSTVQQIVEWTLSKSHWM